MPYAEECFVALQLAVGADEAKSGTDERSLRSDVVQGGVCHHLGELVVGGNGQYGSDGLCGVAVTARGRREAIADLDAAALRLALKADAANCQSVSRASDPVEAERPLLSMLGSGTKEAAYCADVAFEGKIVRPGVGWPRGSSYDPFSLCDIDRVQHEARRS